MTFKIQQWNIKQKIVQTFNWKEKSSPQKKKQAKRKYYDWRMNRGNQKALRVDLRTTQESKQVLWAWRWNFPSFYETMKDRPTNQPSKPPTLQQRLTQQPTNQQTDMRIHREVAHPIMSKQRKPFKQRLHNQQEKYWIWQTQLPTGSSKNMSISSRLLFDALCCRHWSLAICQPMKVNCTLVIYWQLCAEWFYRQLKKYIYISLSPCMHV